MDKILRTLISDGKVSAALADATSLVAKAVKLQGLSPVSAAVLGKVMTAAAVMAAELKSNGEKLYINVKGDGPAGGVYVTADSKLNLKGYIDEPALTLRLADGSPDVEGAIGKGRLTVVRDMGLKENYSGTCPIETGSIEEMFTAYHLYSEQQPTAMFLKVITAPADRAKNADGKTKTARAQTTDGKTKNAGETEDGQTASVVFAGGLVVKAMPDCDREGLARALEIMDKIASSDIPFGSGWLEQTAARYLPAAPSAEYAPVFRCGCNRRYMKRIALALGRDELEKILAEDGEVSVQCHYCNKNYTFTAEDFNKAERSKK